MQPWSFILMLVILSRAKFTSLEAYFLKKVSSRFFLYAPTAS